MPNTKTREWRKQLAVWLCIAALLPLAAWYAAAAFHPPPDEEEYQRVLARYVDSSQWPKDPTERKKFFDDKDGVQKEHDDAEKRFYRVMFWVTYPVGFLAVLGGLVLPVQAVGAGLMFGGIFALTAGCYSAWDVIGRWAHFWSLVIALIGIIIAAFWRFGKRNAVSEQQLNIESDIA